MDYPWLAPHSYAFKRFHFFSLFKIEKKQWVSNDIHMQWKSSRSRSCFFVRSLNELENAERKDIKTNDGTLAIVWTNVYRYEEGRENFNLPTVNKREEKNTTTKKQRRKNCVKSRMRRAPHNEEIKIAALLLFHFRGALFPQRTYSVYCTHRIRCLWFNFQISRHCHEFEYVTQYRPS